MGHLRTTVVGDALARIHEWAGDDVIRQNHIGDWGTPFGMLIEHALDIEAGRDRDELDSDPNAFYKAARAKFEDDPAFATRSRARVVSLQAGSPETLELWQRLIDRSKDYFNRVYRALNVTLTDGDLAGESSYNAELAEVCEELEDLGLARISEGALCAFPEGFVGRDGEPAPLIIRKSDGGYGYATTDLATIRHRVRELHADEILYVVGAPQALHFKMVWSVARAAGWVPAETKVEHVRIGNVLGEDNKILRTRSGESYKLLDLIDMAVERARGVLEETGGIEDGRERDEVARIIGVGAIKYADLSVSHDTEYVFDLERMTALQGNTAPYLQYAVARIRSLLRKNGVHGVGLQAEIKLGLPEERALALAILGFDGAVRSARDLQEPHRLCTYLFSLAQRFSSFYDAAPVLTAGDSERASRIALCVRAEQTLVRGLQMLGIEAPRRM
ncbi:Arginine--tRNA ligase [Clavibacter michiganensis]|uniref:Arginine--tRNA ligase n=1 Tax=Clavibacter michiganensis TaxID=28447 RepID=A0A251Y8Y9_9MICO|nr:Arginine--tRNA ligase [Clavibacter michiganensis]